MKNLGIALGIILLFCTPKVFAETYDTIELELDEDEILSITTENKTNENQTNETPQIIYDLPDNTLPSKDEHEARMNFITGITSNLNNFFSDDNTPTDFVTPLLKDKLTKRFNEGPIESVHLWGAYHGNLQVDIPQEGSTHTTYRPSLITIFLDTKLRGGKDNFRLMFDPTPQNSRSFFQQFVQDAFYENKHIPHHRIIVGKSRPGIVFEGSQSPNTLPLINRSQIARNFSTVRKVGLRVNGKYDYVEYDFGGYSSDTYFSQFLPGVEFDGFLAFKPLAKHENFGKLTTAGSIVAGKRNSVDYVVGNAYIGYEYKKFWAKAEFSVADGSNGASGLTKARREGWCATVGYRITKKLETVLRYDDFIPDKTNKSAHSREFSSGINYYLKGQALRLALNYVFHQSDITNNSHRLMIMTQIVL